MVSKREGRRPVVTLKVVAERAGVSMMTVSNVINGTGRMGPGTRERVQAAIRQTGYIPNIEARRLAGAAGTRVGLIYPDGRTPFRTEVLLAVLDAAARRGVQIVVRHGGGRRASDADELVVQAINGGSEALIVISPFAELLSRSSTFAKLAMPASVLASGGAIDGMNTVRIDNRAASAELTEFLIGLGHREIGFISGPMDHADSAERLAGFRSAMRRHRLPVREGCVVEGRFDFQSGCDGADAMLSRRRRPSAIIASNDDMAAGVQWAAQRAGLRLPADLSVAGFDDTSVARRAWPALTVIRQPISDMASVALELLIDAVSPSPGAHAGHSDIVVAHELVVRESTRPPASRS